MATLTYEMKLSITQHAPNIFSTAVDPSPLRVRVGGGPLNTEIAFKADAGNSTGDTPADYRAVKVILKGTDSHGNPFDATGNFQPPVPDFFELLPSASRSLQVKPSLGIHKRPAGSTAFDTDNFDPAHTIVFSVVFDPPRASSPNHDDVIMEC